jgi:hypothetical protein
MCAEKSKTVWTYDVDYHNRRVKIGECEVLDHDPKRDRYVLSCKPDKVYEGYEIFQTREDAAIEADKRLPYCCPWSLEQYNTIYWELQGRTLVFETEDGEYATWSLVL